MLVIICIILDWDLKNANQAVAGYSDGWNPDTQNGCGTTKNNYDVRYLEGNEDLVNQGWQTMTDPYSGKQLVYKDYHGAMDDEIFNSPALMQDHYISINGGMIKELLLPV